MVVVKHSPRTSALARAIHPDDYDRDRQTQLLEFVAVLLERGQIKLGVQVEGLTEKDLPSTFDDLFEPPKKTPDPSTLLSWEEVERRMGWTTAEG